MDEILCTFLLCYTNRNFTSWKFRELFLYMHNIAMHHP